MSTFIDTMQDKFYECFCESYNSDLSLFEKQHCKISFKIYDVFENQQISSGSYNLSIITYIGELIFISEDCDTNDCDRLWFCNHDKSLYANEKQCRN